MTPIDFLVFGLIVMGGAWGLPLTSLVDELVVAANALIYCVRYLPAMGLPASTFCSTEGLL